MPLYVLLTKLTSDGRKSVMNDPERIFKVHKELETMGAKIIAQYAVLGDYDFVNIIEAQSNEAIARISAQFGSRGTLRSDDVGSHYYAGLCQRTRNSQNYHQMSLTLSLLVCGEPIIADTAGEGLKFVLRDSPRVRRVWP